MAISAAACPDLETSSATRFPSLMWAVILCLASYFFGCDSPSWLTGYRLARRGRLASSLISA